MSDIRFSNTFDSDDSQSGFSSEEPEVVSAGYSELQLVHESEKGFSRVFRAKHHGKWIAIKALRSEYSDNPELKTLLRKEFEIGYTLDHPGIVRTLDFTEVPGIGDCIVMEWIEGRTLRQRIARRNLSEKEAIEIIYSLMETLDYLHSLDVVHRDLKPENIIISAIGGRPRIIDFGLSDTSGHHILKQAAGTPRYMPSEAYSQGRSAKAADDVYALGIIAAELNETLPRKSHYLAGMGRFCSHRRPDKRPRDLKELRMRITRRDKYMPIALLIAIAAGALYALVSIFMTRGASTPSYSATSDTTHVAAPAATVSTDSSQAVNTPQHVNAPDVKPIPSAEPPTNAKSTESPTTASPTTTDRANPLELQETFSEVRAHLTEYAKSSLEILYQEALAIRKKKNAPLVQEDINPLYERHKKRVIDYADKYYQAHSAQLEKARCNYSLVEQEAKRLSLSITPDNTGGRFSKLFE